MEPFGIHLDEDVDIKNEKRIIALGKCKGKASIDSFHVCEIFLKHDSTLHLNASGNSFIMIDTFDNTKLKVIASENAKICINKYGGEITCYKHDNAIIKLIEKPKKTY